MCFGSFKSQKPIGDESGNADQAVIYAKVELGVKIRTGDFLRQVNSGCISELILWFLI